MKPFVAPQPLPLERQDLWLMRVAQAFQDWVNSTYLPNRAGSDE